VVLHKSNKCSLFHKTLTSTDSYKPQGFFTRSVKRLVLGKACEDTELARPILTACTGTQTLVLWMEENPETSEGTALGNIILSGTHRPTRLSLHSSLLLFQDRHFEHGLFQQVTHLDLSWGSVDEWPWEGLCRLQRLTHLSLQIRFRLASDRTVAVMKECMSMLPRSLECLVLLFAYTGYFYDRWCSRLTEGELGARTAIGYIGANNPKCTSRHVGFVRSGSCGDLAKDWTYGHETGDYWEIAERLVGNPQ